jgi:hypothetical protein
MIMSRTITYSGNLSDERRFLILEKQFNFEDYLKGDEVSLLFRDVSFITPFCLLGLLSDCRRIFERTGVKVKLLGLSTACYQYLERMKFFEVGKDWLVAEGDYSRLQAWEENPKSINLIEISRIDQQKEKGAEDVVRLAGLLRQRAKAILSFWLGKDPKEVDKFVTVLSELAQNIFEWSQDFGYVALNKYLYSDKVTLNLAIIDGGVGLHSTVKPKLDRKRVQLNRPADYICYPFTQGMARSKGGGLLKVFSYVKDWNGSLFIRSGTSYAFKRINLITFETRENVPAFSGTHIGIWFVKKK